MSAKSNPIIGAMVGKDGKLDPVEGADPSSPRTYRIEPRSDDENAKQSDQNSG